MNKPTQAIWANAIIDFIKDETIFSEKDIADSYTLMQISNGLKLANQWILKLEEKNNELSETR